MNRTSRNIRIPGSGAWSRMIAAAMLAAVLALLLLPATAVAQTSESTDAVLKTVQLFKSSLDQDSITTMCELMTEDGGAGPLKRLHFEKMQSSLSELINLWRYTPFSYNEPEISTAKVPYRAVVNVTASQLKQNITFTLLKFGSNWYISDIEIYFK